jgi:uncharacterized protein (DUF1015 family)
MISHEGKEIFGIVCCQNIAHSPCLKIFQHELTSPQKIDLIKESIRLDKTQKTPIIVGYRSPHPLQKPVQQAKKKVIFREAIDQQYHTIFELDAESQKLIQSILREKNTFLLLDGHHRFQALKTNYSGPEKIMLWIVPIEDMQVKMFLKILTLSNHEKFNQYLTQHQLIKTPHKKTSELSLYYQGNFLRFPLIDKFIQDCEENQLITKIDYYPCATQEELQRLLKDLKDKSNQFLLLPQRITGKVFVNAMKKEKLLPMHSTCFLPKPIEGLFHYSLCCSTII